MGRLMSRNGEGVGFRGNPGKGITLEMYIQKISNKKKEKEKQKTHVLLNRTESVSILRTAEKLGDLGILSLSC